MLNRFLGFRSLTFAVFTMATLGSADRALAATFSNTADFSASSNPNGVWTYGSTPTLGGAFTPFTTQGTNGALAGWVGPTQASLVQNVTSSPFSAASADWFPGEMNLHPGSDGAASVLRFRAPATTLYDVSAVFYGIDAYPTSTDVHVLINGVSVFDALVNSYRGAGQSHTHTNLALAADDTVDFVVGWGANGSYYYDATGLSVTITQVPEPGTLLLVLSGLGVAGACARSRSRNLSRTVRASGQERQ